MITDLMRLCVFVPSWQDPLFQQRARGWNSELKRASLSDVSFLNQGAFGVPRFLRSLQSLCYRFNLLIFAHERFSGCWVSRFRTELFSSAKSRAWKS